MEVTIYSIGDGQFLADILNSVAVITGHGNLGRPDFETMIGIGMLIGIIMMAFQSLFQGAKEWRWQPIMSCILIYWLSFGASVTVMIEDVREGEIHIVDNVPLGPAFSGSLISKVGYGLTDMMVQAFGAVGPQIGPGGVLIGPDVTNRRFLDSLKILVEFRKSVKPMYVWKNLDNALGGGEVNTYKSVRNYIAECTGRKVIVLKMSASEIKSLKYPDNIKFDSNTFWTEIYTDPGGPSAETCKDAFAKIEAAITSALSNNEYRQLIAVTMDAPLSNSSFPDGVELSKEAAKTLGQTIADENQFIMSHMIAPLFAEGLSEAYSGVNDEVTSLALIQAEQQRNTQAAAEHNLFVKSILPMMTVIEGFVYAITPLAAFIMVLGQKGLGLVGKYLLLLIWIQLWQPIMAIINLFIHTKGAMAVSKYGTLTPVDFTSIAALIESQAELERWISIGGMMAASTPALSFMLVSGSSIAFNSLAQRMAGGDHFNEKAVSPDLSSRQPVFQSKDGYNHDITKGTNRNEGKLSSITMGSATTSGVRASEERVHAAESTMGKEAVSAVQADAKDGAFSRASIDTANDLRRSNSKLAGMVNNQMKSLTSGMNLSDGQRDQIESALTFAAVGAVNAGGVLKALSKGMKQELKNRNDAGPGQGVTDDYGNMVGATDGKYSNVPSGKLEKLANNLDALSDIAKAEGSVQGRSSNSTQDSKSAMASLASESRESTQLTNEEKAALQVQMGKTFAENKGRSSELGVSTTALDKATASYKEAVSDRDTFARTAAQQQEFKMAREYEGHEIAKNYNNGTFNSEPVRSLFKNIRDEGGAESARLMNAYQFHMNQVDNAGLIDTSREAKETTAMALALNDANAIRPDSDNLAESRAALTASFMGNNINTQSKEEQAAEIKPTSNADISPKDLNSEEVKKSADSFIGSTDVGREADKQITDTKKDVKDKGTKTIPNTPTVYSDQDIEKAEQEYTRGYATDATKIDEAAQNVASAQNQKAEAEFIDKYNAWVESGGAEPSAMQKMGGFADQLQDGAGNLIDMGKALFTDDTTQGVIDRYQDGLEQEGIDKGLTPTQAKIYALSDTPMLTSVPEERQQELQDAINADKMTYTLRKNEETGELEHDKSLYNIDENGNVVLTGEAEQYERFTNNVVENLMQARQFKDEYRDIAFDRIESLNELREAPFEKRTRGAD